MATRRVSTSKQRAVLPIIEKLANIQLIRVLMDKLAPYECEHSKLQYRIRPRKSARNAAAHTRQKSIIRNLDSQDQVETR